MEEELSNLNYTLDKFDEVIEDSNLKIGNLPNLYPKDYDSLMEEKYRLLNMIDKVNNSKKSPYFARIDFQSNLGKEKCYIGKVGVQDFDNNIVTVDWRAPIASLYYDSNIGDASYTSPDGEVNGSLTLKRQYVIEDSNLISFNDVDTVSNDELLKPYLNASADNRLKNIVSTIQSEQNKIIRKPLGQNMVIQGVAGSGKTTVALHRIAYLVYNNRNLFKPSDYMVIGPNKFFVDYISSILPDLDVDGVLEYTLEEVFERYTNEHFKISNNLDKITLKDDTSSFKVSFKMKEVIDSYFNKIDILENSDFTIKGIKILSKNTIKDIFNSINKNQYISIKSKIDRLILLILKHIDSNKEQIVTSLINKGVPSDTITSFKEECEYYLRRYFTVLNNKIKNIYIDILKSLNFSTSKISEGILDIEDIPSLIYIKYLFDGDNIYNNIKHIVIDEAQDYGEFTFYTLKKIFPNSSFSIYGDLAQSLYSYRSIDTWEPLKEIFNNLEIDYLNKSYRTTIEIMNEANTINEKLNLPIAIPVIRHGDKVLYKEGNIKEVLDTLKDKYNTVAIITKDSFKAGEVYNNLKDSYKVNLITKDNISYDGGILVVPSYLSKGLEFDSVILIDTFDKDSKLDLKLKYVSMTRALHKLVVMV